jgi:hypothetical protein
MISKIALMGIVVVGKGSLLFACLVLAILFAFFIPSEETPRLNKGGAR